MNIKSRNVLVTGGAGFIGSHLCESIAQRQPKRLVIIDNLFLGKKSNLETACLLFPKLKFYKESVIDYHRIARIISENKIEIVFNLAVIPLPASLVKPKITCEKNILGVLNLCELARKKYFDYLVHYSSSEVYGSALYVPMDENHPYVPSTPYAASKVSGDQICFSYAKVYGIKLTIIRPFNNFGPRQNHGPYAGIIPNVIKGILRRKPINIFGDGKQTRDYLFVKDTVEASLGICESQKALNKAVNLASGREISVNEIVKKILEIMNAGNIKVKHIAARPADVRRHCADVTLARKLIGFFPKVTFDEGLRQTIDWYLKKLR